MQSQSPINKRENLHQFINSISEKRVEAMYTMFESEIETVMKDINPFNVSIKVDERKRVEDNNYTDEQSLEIIKNVYIGLPKKLVYRVIWTVSEYMTNPLSFKHGGSDVVIENHDNSVYGCHWIKNPSKLISKLLINGISQKHYDYGKWEEKKQIEKFKKEIKRIYARKYLKKNYNEVPFKEIWNSETCDEMPWKLLEEYDNFGYLSIELGDQISNVAQKQAQAIADNIRFELRYQERMWSTLLNKGTITIELYAQKMNTLFESVKVAKLVTNTVAPRRDRRSNLDLSILVQTKEDDNGLKDSAPE